eukprot:Phypoly_transcript_10180.p1 GENE.Phypoly_transcript_10180~~Phypoly_transcript_10180.p1  ORF type:complete len:407 (+),score=102.64 Phypoly_transcript_10180:101-1321(+)
MLSHVVLSSARSSLRLARPWTYGALHAKKYSSEHPRTPITDHPIVTNDKAPKEKSSAEQGANYPNSADHRPSHAPPHDAPPPKFTTHSTTTPQQAPPKAPTQAPPQATPPQAAPQQAPQQTQQAAAPQQAPAPTNGTTSGTPEITGPPTPIYENVVAERRGKVGVVRLNRPKQLNALSDALVRDIQSALLYFQDDSSVGAMILTGSEKAFAAGADIKEMSTKTFMDTYKSNMLAQWQDITKIKKPIIAAVAGFALGGGCELAMLCDMIIAAENAMFGQPEVQLGTIPGCGGTQRLIRAVGKSKAMELILTGNQMNAREAELAGLVSRVVPQEKLLEESIRIATKIASYSQPIIAMAKEAVNTAQDMNLQQGLHFERRLFHATFATQDQKEGMTAFKEKRNPNWTNE